jgi:hypothetical protein
VNLAPEGVYVTPANLWWPLWFMQANQYAAPPYIGWIEWHYRNAVTFAQSRHRTDPYPDGVTA